MGATAKEEVCPYMPEVRIWRLQVPIWSGRERGWQDLKLLFSLTLTPRHSQVLRASPCFVSPGVKCKRDSPFNHSEKAYDCLIHSVRLLRSGEGLKSLLVSILRSWAQVLSSQFWNPLGGGAHKDSCVSVSERA